MKIKIFTILITFLSLFLFLSSCEDEEEEKKEAYGDVLVKSIIRGDSVVFGLYYYAYSWTQMKEVTVNRLNQTDYVSLDTMNYRYTFVYNPSDEDYSSVAPRYGTFRFNVEFDNGDTLVVSDYLDSTFLKPVVIEEIDFDSSDGQLKIDWKENKLANSYRVALIDGKNELAYQSDVIGPGQTYHFMNMYANGWQTTKQPKGGEKYKISIAAYQFEPVATAFDVQSISWNDTASVVWTILEDQ